MSRPVPDAPQSTATRRSGSRRDACIAIAGRRAIACCSITPKSITLTQIAFGQSAGPLSSNLIRRCSCFGRNLGGRPGEKRTRNAFSPPRRRAWYQRMTELATQPMRRAASLSEQPESTKAKARRRRSSSRSALPFGLGIDVQAEKQSTYIIGLFLEEIYYILYT